jgi:protein-disulfide isomerase
MEKSDKLQTTLLLLMLGTLLLQVVLSGVLLMKVNAVERLAAREMQFSGPPAGLGMSPVIADVSAEGAPTRGPEDAPVTIVVFSDFGCSACAQVWPTLDEVLGLYPEEVRVAYRAFPLAGDPSSVGVQAANAAFCAGEQGLFWEMHRVLFEHQAELGEADYLAYGEQIGVEMEAFSACLEELRYADQIESDRAAGVEAGVQALPTVFVNGRMTGGAMPLEQFRELIDLVLEESME